MSLMAALAAPLAGESPALERERGLLAAALGDHGRAFACPDAAALDAALDEILGGRFGVLGVAGGDAGVGAVVSALLARGPWPEALRLVPLGGGAQGLLNEDLDIKGAPHEIAARFAGGGRRGGPLAALRRRSAPEVSRRTLKLVTSDLPRAAYGFTFGVGALYRILEATQRRSGAAHAGLRPSLGALARGLMATPEAWEAVPVRMSVDRAPFAASLRLAAASTLPALPLGLRPFEAAIVDEARLHVLWHDMNAAATAALALPLSRGKLQSAQSRTLKAERVVLDLDAGLVLDGELMPPCGPRVVALSPGPLIPMLRV